MVSQKWCVLEQNGRKFGPYICQIWPKKAKQEVGSATQEVRSYLRNRGYIYSIHECQIRPKKLNRKLVPPNSKNRKFKIVWIFQGTKQSIKAHGPLVVFCTWRILSLKILNMKGILFFLKQAMKYYWSSTKFWFGTQYKFKGQTIRYSKVCLEKTYMALKPRTRTRCWTYMYYQQCTTLKFTTHLHIFVEVWHTNNGYTRLF